MTFGNRCADIAYSARHAAYVVVIESGMVATVRGVSGLLFLPGGGSMPGEAPEETVAREVREELARTVRGLRKIGQAIQYFYAPVDDRHFEMSATFFVADFAGEATGQGDHELFWQPIVGGAEAFFHACHAWAVCQVWP